MRNQQKSQAMHKLLKSSCICTGPILCRLAKLRSTSLGSQTCLSSGLTTAAALCSSHRRKSARASTTSTRSSPWRRRIRWRSTTGTLMSGLAGDRRLATNMTRRDGKHCGFATPQTWISRRTASRGKNQSFTSTK